MNKKKLTWGPNDDRHRLCPFHVRCSQPPSPLPSFPLRPCLLFVVHCSPSGCPSSSAASGPLSVLPVDPVPPHEQLLMAAVGGSEVVVVVVVVTVMAIVPGSGIVVSEL
jgi:hypothetical protein